MTITLGLPVYPAADVGSVEPNAAGVLFYCYARDAADNNKLSWIKYVDGLIGPQAGSIIMTAGTAQPPGTVKADGGRYLKSQYPDAWAALGTTWGTDPDPDYFLVPNAENDFPRVASAARPVGTKELDAFQGFTIGDPDQPTWEFFQVHNQILGTAAYGNGGNLVITNQDQNSQTAGQFSKVGLVDDGTNGTPRIADETRPRYAAFSFWVVMVNAVSNPNVLDVTDLANSLDNLTKNKSALLPIVNGAPNVAAHGLGAVPGMIDYRLVCGTAEHGYTVGQEITADSGLSIGADTTNVFAQVGSAGISVLVYNTGATATLTPASWNLQLIWSRN